MPIQKIIHRLEIRLKAMQKLRGKSAWAPLLVIFSLILAYFVLVQPLIDKMNTVDKQTENAKLQYAKFTRMFSSKEEYKSRFQEYESTVIQKKSDEEEQAIMLKEIEQITQGFQGRLRVTDVKPRPMRKEELLKVYSVQLQLETDTPTFGAFLYQVATAKQLLRVDEYTLTPKERNAGVIETTIVVSKILVEN